MTCRVLRLARQPYYRWRANPITDAEVIEAYRANALFDAHRDDPEFGYRYLVEEARDVGETMAERTAWRICSQNRLWSVFGKKRGKNGKMKGKNQAAEKREVLARHGGIPRAGLAKKSWGWIAKGIHAASNQGDLSWKRTKGERRDPRRYVKGESQTSATGAFARIRNHLDYIRDAMPPGAVSEAIVASTKRLEHNIKNHIERVTK